MGTARLVKCEECGQIPKTVKIIDEDGYCRGHKVVCKCGVEGGITHRGGNDARWNWQEEQYRKRQAKKGESDAS